MKKRRPRAGSGGGDSRGSLLAQKIQGTQTRGALMPPNGKMTADEMRSRSDWIAAGAPDRSRCSESIITNSADSHESALMFCDSSVLAQTVEAFGSVISNNLNRW